MKELGAETSGTRSLLSEMPTKKKRSITNAWDGETPNCPES